MGFTLIPQGLHHSNAERRSAAALWVLAGGSGTNEKSASIADDSGMNEKSASIAGGSVTNEKSSSAAGGGTSALNAGAAGKLPALACR